MVSKPILVLSFRPKLNNKIINAKICMTKIRINMNEIFTETKTIIQE